MGNFLHDMAALAKARKDTVLKFKKVTNEEYENVLLNRIAQLETQLLEQDDYIRSITKQPEGAGWLFPFEWQLTHSEFKILVSVVNAEIATKQRIYSELYSNNFTDNPAAEKIVDVYICKLRKKVRDFKIETIWSRGYFIEASMRKLIREKYFVTPATFASAPKLKID